MFKLILCDYGMTEMDGITCMKIIRKLIVQRKETQRDLNSKNVKMPYICCVTAYQEEKFAIQALSAGMDAVVIKPIFKN